MSDTTGRLLSLLSVLQSGGSWTGPQLADRLGVTARTVRRDVERLRDLGYPIDADVGAIGGYRFGTGGSRLPPLMLDDDEAVALAVCVRSSPAHAGTEVGEAAGRALAKLEQMLPTRLRPRIAAFTAATEPLTTPATAGDPVDSDLLVTLSRACRERDVLALRYEDRSGRGSDRRIEPVRLVSTGRRWYLMAYDLDRADWRTFRADRIGTARTTGHRFVTRDGPDPVAFVQRSITTSPYRHHARIEFAASAEDLAARIPPTVGLVEAVDDATCVLTLGAMDLDIVAIHIGMLGLPFRVLEPPELTDRITGIVATLTTHGHDVRREPSGGDADGRLG